MKIKFLFFQILLILTFKGFAQSSEMWYLDLWNEDGLEFNDSLIKNGHIKSAIVLKFIGKIDVDGLPESFDTIYVLSFDAEGKPLKKVYKNGSIYDYDKKPIVINEKKQRFKDSLVREFEDSTHYYKMVYDADGNIIDKKFWPKQSYLSKIGCGTGTSGRFILKYDNLGRLVYYRNFRDGEYSLISYTCNGKKTQTFSLSDNELQNEEFRFVYETNNMVKIIQDPMIITIKKDDITQLPIGLDVSELNAERKIFGINYTQD